MEEYPLPMTGPYLSKSYFRAWHLEAEKFEATDRGPKTRKARMPRWPSRRRGLRGGQSKDAYNP
jgi:hypothetical protein